MVGCSVTSLKGRNWPEWLRIVSVSSEWHQAMTSLSKVMALCVFAWQPNDHCCLIRLAPGFRLVLHSASSNLKCALGGTEFALKCSFRLDFFGVRSGIVHFWNLRPRFCKEQSQTCLHSIAQSSASCSCAAPHWQLQWFRCRGRAVVD